MKHTTRLILDMAYAFRDAEVNILRNRKLTAMLQSKGRIIMNAWVRGERCRELRWRRRKNYVRYLRSLERIGTRRK